MSQLAGLYAIADVGALSAVGLPVIEFARSVLAARPPILQLRAKELSSRETLSLLRELAPLCRASGALLFANDRADLALLSGCDGVHVGQEDLGVEDVRRIAPALRVGISTHDLGQLAAALRAHPDYVAFGPVFPTASKDNPDPVVGVIGLSKAKRLATEAGAPLVAIGGIDAANACEVAAHADLGAVIGALLPRGGEGSAEVTQRARILHERLGGPK